MTKNIINKMDTKNSDAVKYLTRIKDEYSKSDYASQVDLYLGKAQAAN